MFEPGVRVHVKADPGRVGVLTGKTRERGGRLLKQVVFPDGTSYIPEDQLECLPEVLDPIDLLRSGRLGRASDLRRNLTHIRLSGRLANLIYSMETTNTDFYPYQFKPVLKFLNSPSNGLLLADEVGLGKTIEAGLIWTELRSRFDLRRLMVLCPAILREKWHDELLNKFGIEAQILGIKEILSFLKRSEKEGPYLSFAIIGSLQSLRPPRGWKKEDEEEVKRVSAQLAEFLENKANEEPLIDFLIIEEAHYMRNPETSSAELGRLLRHVAENVVLLSATPIHLRSRNLYQLLNLVDEDTFNRPDIFDMVLEANAPLVKVRDGILGNKITNEELLSVLSGALEHPFLKGNRQIISLLERGITAEQVRSPNYRTEVAHRLENINLLGHVVARTRKREVQEWRVVREVVAESITLTEAERKFYDAVTELVRSYCNKYQKHEGFLLVMPQRQVSSSMAAALREWQRRKEGWENQLYEDIGKEEGGQESPGPIVQELLQKSTELGDLKELLGHDSKYNRLRSILKKYFKSHPEEKIVLFSYFRPTLKYLNERLTSDGIDSIVLMGGPHQEKSDVLKRFSSPDGPSVLLSSEVGSEGIDLQFSRVLVNYDLPWNPMRVEQRIGRIDRIGQKASKIVIWNLFAEDTIDSRIYECLYKRLKIFEYALGGLESVLGDEIRKLTIELLSGKLTPEQEAERIELTATVLANIRLQEDQLEEESANLVAYGDYILNQIKAARELNRWISGEDLWLYARDFISKFYAGSEFKQVKADQLIFDLRLSNEGKNALDRYLRDQKLPFMTRLAQSSPSPVRCRFENRVSSGSPGREEIISQFHPLIRFVTHQIKTSGESYYPAVGLSVNQVLLPRLTQGIYAFSIQRWSVSGIQERELVYFVAINMGKEDQFLDEDEAEHLITTAAIRGDDWLEAKNVISLEIVAELANRCLSFSDQKYEEYISHLSAENNDRADLQEKSIDRHFENQKAKLESVKETHLTHGRTSLATATSARIKFLEERVTRKKLQINERRSLGHRKDEVCVGLIQVEGG
jgi:superfamily II DNA or RNA helicase